MSNVVKLVQNYGKKNGLNMLIKERGELDTIYQG